MAWVHMFGLQRTPALVAIRQNHEFLESLGNLGKAVVMAGML